MHALPKDTSNDNRRNPRPQITQSGNSRNKIAELFSHAIGLNHSQHSQKPLLWRTRNWSAPQEWRTRRHIKVRPTEQRYGSVPSLPRVHTAQYPKGS